MSGDDVGIFGKAVRLFSCLAASSDGTSGVQRVGVHGNGTLSKAPAQPSGLSQPNGTAGSPQAGSTASILRHNPIDVCLTLPEPVSVLQGNPSQRAYEASWCGVPVHLHVLTFVKRPNPIAQLPGPTSPHATVAAALDAPPPVQANMLTQPDMIAVATEVEAALVQLIAEPTPQVLPVLACAKVTCRAHIGSPGDEHVTQRIIAEVHIVTPRVPGLVSLSQWLHERWPQCDIANGSGEGVADVNLAAAPPNPIASQPPPATAGGGGTAQMSQPLLPSAGAPSTSPHPIGPQSHRLAASTTPVSTTPVTGAASSAAGGGDGGRSTTRLASPASGLGLGLGPGPAFGPAQSGRRLGASQPIAEGVTSREHAKEFGKQQLSATSAAVHGSSINGDVVPACIPCLSMCFAPSAMSVVPPVLLEGPLVHRGKPPANQGKAAPGGTTTLLGNGAPVSETAAAAAPASTAANSSSAPRRLAGPSPNATLGVGRQRLPLPPQPPLRPKLPVPEALEVLICLAEALRNLHRRGLTHGSLTPKTIQLQLIETETAAAAAVAAATVGDDPCGQQPQATSLPESCPTTLQSEGKLKVASTQQSLSQPQAPQGPSQTIQTIHNAVGRGEATNMGLQSAAASSFASADILMGTRTDTDTPGVSPPLAAEVPNAVGVTSSTAVAAAAGGEEEEEEEHGVVVAPGTLGTTALLSSCQVIAEEAASSTSLLRAPAAAVGGCEAVKTEGAAAVEGDPEAAAPDTGAAGGGGAPAKKSSLAMPDEGADAAGRGNNRIAAASDASLRHPVVLGAPAPSPEERVKFSQPIRRRQKSTSSRGGIRAMLPLPAVGPAVLQLQTWGRARPVGLPRDHLLWCAPELLNAGGIGWGPPLLARRSGNGSGNTFMGLGPLDQSLGCRNGNRLRAALGHHSSRHFGDGSYGGSLGGNSRRFRCASSLLMGQDAGDTNANANGITPSCDVYSLGMLMWYLVSGQVPFQHLATQDQVLRVKEIGSLDEQLPFSSELPMGYIQLARRCWAPLPMQRPTVAVVLSEMRSLRAQLLGLPQHRDLIGEHGHGYGYGGSSMGEMTGDSRLSFTLSLPLSSRDLSNGEDNYSLVRPPLELAFGANDASGNGSGTDANPAGGNGRGACSGAPPPPPPLLKTALPAGLLTAFTAPRRASAGGGSGLMDDDDNYSDTDRFTEHADTNDHTEASGGGTPYSSPTGGTTGGGRACINSTSARLRSATAIAAAAAATSRSFRMFRGMSHRPGSTAGSVGRSGGNGGAVAAALLAANGSRRGGVVVTSHSHGPASCGATTCDKFSSSVGAGQQQQLQQQYQQQLAARATVHAGIDRAPAAAVAGASSLGARCASSSAIMGLSTAGPPPQPPVVVARRFSLTHGAGSCVPAAAAAAVAASNSSGGPGGGCGDGGGGGPGSSGNRLSAMISATSTSLGCLAVPCGNGSGTSSDEKLRAN